LALLEHGEKLLSTLAKKLDCLSWQRAYGTSFDNLIGSRHQSYRQIHVNRAGGLLINNKTELCRQLNREIAWLLPLQDAIHNVPSGFDRRQTSAHRE
jgi:hypothetical protein